MIIEIDEQYLDTVCRLHMQELDKQDFSVQMGPWAVKVFYKSLIQSQYGKCFLKVEGGNILSVCTVFFDYPAFSDSLKKKLLIPFLVNMCLHPSMVFAVVKNLRLDNPIMEENRKGALGMIIRNKEIDLMRSLMAFAEVYKHAMRELQEKQISSVWGSTREDNAETIKFFKNNGYKLKGQSQNIVFYEKPLG